MATRFSQSVITKAQKEKLRITKVDANHYRAGKYVLAVTFDDEGLPTIESCRDETTNKHCLGFFHNGQCYHGAAVSIHVIEQETKEAA